MSHQNMQYIGLIPNKCIQMEHARKVDQIKRQSIIESLFMIEYEHFYHVVI